MNRNQMLQRLNSPFDILIIGGGATGLGALLDASSRGYKTVLIEQADFAQGTSSRSSKLIHGGIRYLREGKIPFVLESLKERGSLAKNAPHLVSKLAFVIPTTNFLANAYYLTGLKIYDGLSGKQSFGPSRKLSKKELFERLPTLNREVATGGVAYFDGQFDDARLAIDLASTAAEKGGVLLNHMPIQKLIKKMGKVVGVTALDLETGESHDIFAKVVINATGAFVDAVCQMDEKSNHPSISPSQGTHIVLEKAFYPSDMALVIPKTSDGRVVFILPWHEHVLIGTTDVPAKKITLEPTPTNEEINYLLEHVAKYLLNPPSRDDILSTFSGIRPLISAKSGNSNTAALSRDHHIDVSLSNLITVTGGKWTTYRKIGEDVIDQAARTAGLPFIPSKTQNLPIHSGEGHGIVDEKLLERIDSNLPCRPIDVIWSVRNEMAKHLDDVLSRRTRCLFLRVKDTLAIAPKVAHIMAEELGKDSSWEEKELKAFRELAKNYLPQG